MFNVCYCKWVILSLLAGYWGQTNQLNDCRIYLIKWHYNKLINCLYAILDVNRGEWEEAVILNVGS